MNKKSNFSSTYFITLRYVFMPIYIVLFIIVFGQQGTGYYKWHFLLNLSRKMF
jgi:hypothetical protein